MEIWTIIEQDHRKIEDLLRHLRDEQDEPLVQHLKHTLSAHMRGEEGAVYPTLRAIPGFAELIDAAIAEHRTLRGMMDQLAATDGSGRPAIAERLEAAFKAHSEGEERGIFPLAKKELPHHVVEHMKHEFESAKESDETGSAPHIPHGEHAPAPTADAAAGARRNASNDALGEVLERLVRAEQAVVAAYEAAIDRLAEEGHRSALGQFAEDHRRHLHDFSRMLEAMGRAPPGGGGRTGIAEWSGVALGGLFGDTAVLKAMRSNEEVTLSAYDAAASDHGLPAGGEILQKALEEGRRRREWFRSELG
ncbi:MAG TPA: hemerythrin domain-containing protein [Xanthobacteraceae bacterium]|nr:hemerythrin domain-containing protein [Xanthobacteraceae bacterium]